MRKKLPLLCLAALLLCQPLLLAHAQQPLFTPQQFVDAVNAGISSEDEKIHLDLFNEMGELKGKRMFGCELKGNSICIIGLDAKGNLTTFLLRHPPAATGDEEGMQLYYAMIRRALAAANPKASAKNIEQFFTALVQPGKPVEFTLFSRGITGYGYLLIKDALNFSIAFKL